MSGQKFSFRIRPWMAAMVLTTAILLSAPGCQSSAGPGGTSGGLADVLIPGHQEAALRKRAEADSFPSATQALHAPEGSDHQGP